MRYLSYRISLSWVEGDSIVHGFFVLGQRESDLNWSLLGSCNSFGDAVDLAFFLWDGSPNTFIFGPGGYTMKRKEVEV